MAGFLLLILFSLAVAGIEILWPVLLAVAVLGGLWALVVVPWQDRRALELRDRIRHERARTEIDRIALRAQREMYESARRHGALIEGTAVEVSDD
jgi:hypothetical protein